MINSSTTTNSFRLYRKAAITLFLIVFLPFISSMINLTFAESWKVHFFPAAIILAAMVFGASGALVAGVAGSLYSAILTGNPYMIVGNALFGLFTGIFYKKTNKIILSVLLAFICELPWLIITDYYFMNLPAEFIARLLIVLLLADILWAALILLLEKPVRKYLC